MSQPHESRVYSDLARFYDFFFGRVFVDREHEVIESLNLRPGNRVLEVGVGTGIALDGYPPYAHVVAIDPSADMLERAKKRVTENGLEAYRAQPRRRAQSRLSRQQLRLRHVVPRADCRARSVPDDVGDGARV